MNKPWESRVEHRCLRSHCENSEQTQRYPGWYRSGVNPETDPG